MSRIVRKFMAKTVFQFLEETEKIAEAFDPNQIKKLLNSTMTPEEKKSALKSYHSRQSYKDQQEIKNSLRNTEFSDLFKKPIELKTEGEDTMSKKTNLDMFLEGIEEVEVSKKPKFHSIHRLYEAKDCDFKKKDEIDENEDCDADDEEELDEVIVNEGGKKVQDDDEAAAEAEGEEDAEGDEGEEGEEHEAAETDDDEAAEQEAGDEDEEGGADESPDTDDAEVEKEEAFSETQMQQIREMISQAMMAKEETDTDELDESAQGYAAGLKGVRKDAGAKKLKSGSNKVPAPKVQITGDKKLLKKPTVAKGETYPKSSVAGAARPGAPKVKKS
jgi:hypothetical protein